VPEEEMTEVELLPQLQAASVRSRIGLGERKGKRVRRLGALEFADFEAELKGPLCATTQGFSLHAEVYCAPWEREKLEKLCRYIARPAIAEDRLQLRPSGDVVLRLKTPYSDGTSHLLFSGLEFVEKLAALKRDNYLLPMAKKNSHLDLLCINNQPRGIPKAAMSG
jgi:hypothetical protein